MTPGPASRTVTLLPRKSPTPIAPPMASMVSWRWVSWRFSSSVSAGIGSDVAAVDCGDRGGGESEGSAMLGQIEQGVAEAVNLIQRVVVDERGAHHAAFHWNAEPLHQARGVHVAVANADASLRDRFRNLCWSDIRQIEAKRRHALVNLVHSRKPVDFCAAIMQDLQHLTRKRFFVGSDILHRTREIRALRVSDCAIAGRLGAFAEGFQIRNGRIHASDIFIDKGAGFNFPRWLVGDELFAKRRK